MSAAQSEIESLHQDILNYRKELFLNDNFYPFYPNSIHHFKALDYKRTIAKYVPEILDTLGTNIAIIPNNEQFADLEGNYKKHGKKVLAECGTFKILGIDNNKEVFAYNLILTKEGYRFDLFSSPAFKTIDSVIKFISEKHKISLALPYSQKFIEFLTDNMMNVVTIAKDGLKSVMEDELFKIIPQLKTLEDFRSILKDKNVNTSYILRWIHNCLSDDDILSYINSNQFSDFLYRQAHTLKAASRQHWNYEKLVEKFSICGLDIKEYFLNIGRKFAEWDVIKQIPNMIEQELSEIKKQQEIIANREARRAMVLARNDKPEETMTPNETDKGKKIVQHLSSTHAKPKCVRFSLEPKMKDYDRGDRKSNVCKPKK